jgi:hypothetical protein
LRRLSLTATFRAYRDQNPSLPSVPNNSRNSRPYHSLALTPFISMGALDHFDHAVLGLAVLSTFLASGALLLAIRTAVVKPPPFPVPPVPVVVVNDDSAKSKKSDADDSDDEDDGKDKEKEKENLNLVDGAYKVIHQRYNRKEYKWDDFDPLKDASAHEGVIFIVYHRHYDPNAVRQLERLVEVHSESLKEILRGCLKHIDTVFDPKPMVHVQKKSLTDYRLMRKSYSLMNCNFSRNLRNCEYN